MKSRMSYITMSICLKENFEISEFLRQPLLCPFASTLTVPSNSTKPASIIESFQTIASSKYVNTCVINYYLMKLVLNGTDLCF